jgi:hypothetical protein
MDEEMNALDNAGNDVDCRMYRDLDNRYPEKNISAKISIYENEIPEFVEVKLEQLYGNIYSTLARFHIYGAVTNASTYVARKGEVITAIFIFSEERGEIKIINQQVEIDAADIVMFAETIFSKYRSAKIISFYAINTNIPRLHFPFQKFNTLKENIIFLPATLEEYMASLSTSFRYQLRDREKKLRRKFPSFRYESFSKSEVSEQLVREIVNLTCMRMAVKKKAPYINEADIGLIVQLTRVYGSVYIATIDGQICAGTIWYRVGRRNHMHIIAHDPAYDKYMLGNQIAFSAVRDCIACGGRECWLMSGGEAYKSRFLAIPMHLDSLVIFRSRAQFMLNLPRVSATAVGILLRQVKKKLVQSAQGDRFLAHLAVKGLTLARSIKHFFLATAGRRK